MLETPKDLYTLVIISASGRLGLLGLLCLLGLLGLFCLLLLCKGQAMVLL